jgi:hypothetical protein
MKEKLSIILPTYKRPEGIKFFLEQSSHSLFDLEINLYIHDSSPDSFTEVIVNEYISNRFSNIHYIRHVSSINPDAKMLKALMNMTSEYVWLCSDGCVPNLLVLSESVLPLMKSDIDIIYLSVQDPYNSNGKYYSNPVEFFKECFWGITGYGGSIIKKKFFEFLSDKQYVEYLIGKYSKTAAFLYPCMIFDKLSMTEFRAIHICSEYYLANPLKTTSSWMKNGTVLQVWGETLVAVVHELPNIYDEYKAYVIREMWNNTNLTSFSRLLAMRAYGGLNIEIYRYYTKNGILPQVSDHLLKLKFFSICPISLAKMIKNLYHILKKRWKYTFFE